VRVLTNARNDHPASLHGKRGNGHAAGGQLHARDQGSVTMADRYLLESGGVSAGFRNLNPLLPLLVR
jgi:hypothetical protein